VPSCKQKRICRWCNGAGLDGWLDEDGRWRRRWPERSSFASSEHVQRMTKVTNYECLSHSYVAIKCDTMHPMRPKQVVMASLDGPCALVAKRSVALALDDGWH
jgi:hypothetical protein